MKINKIKGNWRNIDIFAYFLLAFFLMFFFGMTFYDPSGNMVSLVLFLISAVFLIAGFFVEWTKSVHKRWTITRDFEVVIATTIGAVAAFAISNYISIGNYGVLGPLIGTSFVGLAYAYIADFLPGVFKQLQAPVYCGAFAGMVSPLVLSSVWMVALAGFFTGLLFVVSHEIYTGTGGKLGTMGFGGVVIVKKLILGLFGG
jgi:hypothetical protein